MKQLMGWVVVGKHGPQLGILLAASFLTLAPDGVLRGDTNITGNVVVNGTLTVTTNLTVEQALSVGNTPLFFADIPDATVVSPLRFAILTNNSIYGLIGLATPLGEDTGVLMLNGGGGNSDPSRGAYLWLGGNQYSNFFGQLWLGAGNVAGGDIFIATSNAVPRLIVRRNGQIDFCGNRGTNLADPIEIYDAATRGWVENLVAGDILLATNVLATWTSNFVATTAAQIGRGDFTVGGKLTVTSNLVVNGTLTAGGPVNFCGNRGTNLATPVSFSDAATLGWVESAVASYAVSSNAFVVGTLIVGSGMASGANAASFGAARAVGDQSFAQGSSNTVAAGLCSHAEGSGTLANGYIGAHAEGDMATASGCYAPHAEGYGTLASGGSGAHAEGGGTTASGVVAPHAEGNWTMANGDWTPHAEGNWTTASGGTAAHSEGTATTASGDWGSHAEGESTIASGSHGAHAEGMLTVAGGQASHAAGKNAFADHDNTYVWSDGTTTHSNTNSQFTVFATNGIRLLGGRTQVVTPSGANGGEAVNCAYLADLLSSTTNGMTIWTAAAVVAATNGMAAWTASAIANATNCVANWTTGLVSTAVAQVGSGNLSIGGVLTVASNMTVVSGLTSVSNLVVNGTLTANGTGIYLAGGIVHARQGAYVGHLGDLQMGAFTNGTAP